MATAPDSRQPALRPGYQAFLNLKTTQESYQQLAEIINKYAKITDLTKWKEEDADVVIGLYDEDKKERFSGCSRGGLKFYLQITSRVKGTSIWADLDKEVGDDDKLAANVQRLHKELCSSPDNLIKRLRDLYPNAGADAAMRPRARAAVREGSCLKIANHIKDFLWNPCNIPQKIAMSITPFAITSGILGVLTAKSAALTTAGTVLGNMLPGFVTAFAMSHAMPIAAIAFYAVAAALGAAALILLLAGTGKQLVDKYSNPIERILGRRRA